MAGVSQLPTLPQSLELRSMKKKGILGLQETSICGEAFFILTLYHFFLISFPFFLFFSRLWLFFSCILAQSLILELDLDQLHRAHHKPPLNYRKFCI